MFNGEATDTNVSLWFGPIGARTHTQSDLSTFMFVKTTDTNDRLNLTSSFKSIAGMIVFLGLGLGCCFQQYYSYIVAVSFFFFLFLFFFWRSVLLVEETGEHHRLAASH